MGGWCRWWNACDCGQAWLKWQAIAERGDWKPDQFRYDCAEMEIKGMLECVARSCPDPVVRKHAIVQLMHPVFTEYGRYGR